MTTNPSRNLIRSNDRIHLSPKLLKSVKDKKQTVGQKPNGLWYAFGKDWIDFAETSYELRSGKFHAYKVDIYKDALLQIRTRRDVKRFGDVFGAKDGIDWREVAKQYWGIEILNNTYKARLNQFNFQRWDMNSGCIWSPLGIKSITYIGKIIIKGKKVESYRDLMLFYGFK